MQNIYVTDLRREMVLYRLSTLEEFLLIMLSEDAKLNPSQAVQIFEQVLDEELSPGLVHATLHALERRGLVESERNMHGVIVGAGEQYYHITTEGRHALFLTIELRRMLLESVAEHKQL